MSSLVLAPMAGVNDPVFRALCKRMGAGLTYSEMISSKGLAYKNKKTFTMLQTLPEERPFAVQLFGCEPEVMAAEARVISEYLARDLALIDINMGCPARKVSSAGSGAALLTQPKLAYEIVSAVSSAVDVPVTVKMRLVQTDTPAALRAEAHAGNPRDSMGSTDQLEAAGSTDSTSSTDPADPAGITTSSLSASLMENTLAFAHQMAKAGAAAIAIHGRTAQQMYKGTAAKEIVAHLVSELRVPVIASGDVFSQADIDTYLAMGASAVMAARGARGNPWIFSGTQPRLTEIISVAREHTERLYAWEPHKLVWMRKHLAWYFKGTPCALRVRKAVQSAITLDDYLGILNACAESVT